ncbi:MAG: EamA family transporter [Flavobacteriales bacterium]
MYFYLITGIFCSSFLFTAFKLFEKYRVDSFKAIVFNYITAFVLAFMMSNGKVVSALVVAEWRWLALLLGLIFIVSFNIMARSSQEAGVAISSVANKMSFVGPILFGIFFLGEHYSVLQNLGVLLAIVAVILSSGLGTQKLESKKLKLPILLFFAGLAIDIILHIGETQYIKEGENLLFTGSTFGIAAVLGFMYVVYLTIKEKSTPKLRDIIGGILLGIPNFFSIFFFLSALEESEKTGWDSSKLFPMANLGIIVVNALVGYFIFKEKLNRINYIGILLALLSIALIII